MKIFAVVVVICAITTVSALAGPMPQLPELPALPSDYHSPRDSGSYGGVLSGYSLRSGSAGLGVLIGHTFHSSDVIFGVEGQALVSRGDAEIEAGLRAGVSITDHASAHGYLGLGYSVANEFYAATGASVEFRLTSDLVVRADYKYQVDLSGDANDHKVLAGLIRVF